MSEVNQMGNVRSDDQQGNKEIKGIEKRINELTDGVSYVSKQLYSNKKQNSYRNIICTVLVIVIIAMLLLQTNVIKLGSGKALLIVHMTNEDAEEKSDKTQVENALKNGGTIFVPLSSDGLEKAFGKSYVSYGATNSKGYVYLEGAAMNYIISKGWSLIQAPSTGLSSIYYFEK